jgi:hypothetical protein
MASSQSWPFDDEDRPSGSVWPLSQADLQASWPTTTTIPKSCWPAPVQIGRWWRRGSGPAWAGQAAPPRRGGGRSGRPSGPSGRAACRGGWPPSLVWVRRRSPWQPAGASAGTGPRRAGGRGGWLRAVVPAQPRCHRLAARGGRGATHRPALGCAGVPGLGGPARPGPPRQPGQPRPLGDRSGWGVRNRLQAVPRPAPARPSGRLRHGRYPLAPVLCAVSFEADQAAQVLI